MIRNWPGEETGLSRWSRIDLEKKLDWADDQELTWRRNSIEQKVQNWAGEETRLSRKLRIGMEKKLDGALNWASKSQQMGNLPKLVQEEAQEEDDKVGTNSKKPLVKEKHELMGEQARSFN